MPRLNTLVSAGLVLVALAPIVACSSVDSTAKDQLSSLTFAEEPWLRLHSDEGRFEVELRSLPASPPVRGDNRIELRVLDADTGSGIEGLAIDMVPFMPAMGHGSGVDPSSTEVGDGGYELYPVRLSMPGRWELRTTLGDADPDTLTPTFEVP